MFEKQKKQGSRGVTIHLNILIHTNMQWLPKQFIVDIGSFGRNRSQA